MGTFYQLKILIFCWHNTPARSLYVPGIYKQCCITEGNININYFLQQCNTHCLISIINYYSIINFYTTNEAILRTGINNIVFNAISNEFVVKWN